MKIHHVYSPFGGPAWGVRAEDDPRFMVHEAGRRLRLQNPNHNPEKGPELDGRRAGRFGVALGRLRGLREVLTRTEDVFIPEMHGSSDVHITQVQSVNVRRDPGEVAVGSPLLGNITSAGGAEHPLQPPIEKPAPRSEYVGS